MIRRTGRNESELQKSSTGEKTRVQFDFSPDAYDRLVTIMHKSGASTKAETVRKALSLYEWFINEVDPDDTIKVINDQGEIVSSFKAKLLHRL
jgi:hypothetical protein